MTLRAVEGRGGNGEVRFDACFSESDDGARGVCWSTTRICLTGARSCGWWSTSGYCWKGSWRIRTGGFRYLPLLTEAEERQLLVEWNDTGREYPQESVHPGVVRGAGGEDARGGRGSV